MTEIRASIRCLCAAAIAGLLLAPLGVSAAPTPSPTLDTILAKPPSSDFREVPTAKLHGSFTAHDWATVNAGAVSATEIETTLNFEGFVAGYSSAWIQPASGKRLTETVMAFAGGLGARNVLAALERGDKASATYKYADTLSGVDQSYGAHLVDVTNKAISDGFAFVKGNDVFVIVAVSAKDDVLALATTQAQTQFDAAPDSTIPSAQWPENAFPKGGASDPGRWIAVSLILAGLFVLAGVVLAVVLGSRRAAFATANPGAMSLAAASAHPGSGVLELEAPQLHGPAAASTIAAVPAAAHRPVRIPTIHPDDLYTVGGAAVSSLCLAWLTYWQLAPEPGVLGFVLAWLGAFAAMYWLATRRILGRLFAKDRLISVVITSGAVVMLAPLLLIVSFVAYKGFSVITPHFFTETAQFCGQLDAATCGGVGHAIVGTLEQVGIATLMSVPLAVLCAVFLNEI
ncbi:MAG TPA: hypothetical protein VHW94_10765, partial [Candidatus Dormibacteraeota bacterium]|nr:hypothetical protein [Candidatus Dormibacteraeota bacterium]